MNTSSILYGLPPILQARTLLDYAEARRVGHERPTIDTGPLGPSKGGEELATRVDDYAVCGQCVADAMAHLDEALPNGQKERAECAYRAAVIGLQEMGNWMRTIGFEV